MWCMWAVSKKWQLTTNFLSENLNEEYSRRLKKNIRNYLRDIGSVMSTEFIWLIIKTYRDNHCTIYSDADSPRFWNTYKDSFCKIWQVQLLIITHNIIPVLANTLLLLYGQWRTSDRDRPAVWSYHYTVEFRNVSGFWLRMWKKEKVSGEAQMEG